MRPDTVPVASQGSPVKNSEMTDLLLRDYLDLQLIMINLIS